MSVHDFDISTADANTGIAVRAAINAALQALASQSSGATDPAIIYPFQARVDTSTSPATVYWRKADNSAWARCGYVSSDGVFVLDRKGGVVSKTGAYTATQDDYMLLCDATAAAFAITLPSAATVKAGKEYVVKKTDSSVNAITVDPDGTETIDGSATYTISLQNDWIAFISDGTNWRVVGRAKFLVPSAAYALTDAAAITTDASLGNTFSVTLGGNRTLGNPTNPTADQKCLWKLKQDGTGSRTITLDTKFRLGTDMPPIVLSTAANKIDYLGAMYNAADDKWDVIGFIKGY